MFFQISDRCGEDLHHRLIQAEDDAEYAAADAGLPVSEVAKKLKMHEYRTKLYAAAAKKTTSARLGVVLSLCREADLAIKNESSDYGRLRALVCEAAR